MISIPPDYRELQKDEKIRQSDVKIEIHQTVFNAANHVRSGVGLTYIPNPTRIIVRHKYDYGSRVTIVNAKCEAFNGKTGRIVYFRPSRLVPNQFSYFIDLDETVDGNGAINLRAEFLVPEVLTVKVKLNDEYTAEVSQKGIKVGCQTFPITIIDELAKAHDKVHEI